MKNNMTRHIFSFFLLLNISLAFTQLTQQDSINHRKEYWNANHTSPKGLAPFQEDYINKKCGYTDKNGKVIIKAKYDRAWKFKNGLTKVKLNGKYGYINEKDESIIPIIYSK